MKLNFLRKEIFKSHDITLFILSKAILSKASKIISETIVTIKKPLFKLPEKIRSPVQPPTTVTISCVMPQTKCEAAIFARLGGEKNKIRPANSPILPGVKLPTQRPVHTDCHTFEKEIFWIGEVIIFHLKTSMPQFRKRSKKVSISIRMLFGEKICLIDFKFSGE